MDTDQGQVDPEHKFRIMASPIKGYHKNKAQEVDTAKTRKNADYLVGEYIVALGPDWKVWIDPIT